MRKDLERQENEYIYDRWLACATQEEIAAELDMARKTVADRLEKILAEKGKMDNLGLQA